MPVVTIRGEMGSGAPEIGKITADKLHIDYVDREIIASVASRLKWSKEGIADKEAPPGTILGRIAEALGHSYYPDGAGYAGAYLPIYDIPLNDNQYLAGLKSVIEELTRSQAVVIRGRGSQFILKDMPGALHVLIVAPEDDRIKRIMDSLNMNENAARKEIARSDKSHREFIRRYFQADLENPVNYDVVVNTRGLRLQDSAAIVIKALQYKQKTVERPARSTRKKQT